MSVSQQPAFHAAGLSGSAAALFRRAGVIPRAKAKYRPYICPLHVLLPLVPTGSRVLDVGCGNGLLLGLLAVTGRIREGVGYDIADDVLSEARLMAADFPDALLTFHRADSIDAVPGGEFDVVTMVDVLHHIPTQDQQSFWHAAASRVRPGGCMVYKDMVAGDWRSWANSAHDIVVSGQIVRHIPASRVDEWAAGAGFVQRAGGRYDLLWYGHELRVFERPPSGS